MNESHKRIYKHKRIIGQPVEIFLGYTCFFDDCLAKILKVLIRFDWLRRLFDFLFLLL